MPYIPSIWIWLGIIASITLSGLFSGLNLAIFTLSQLRLQLEADGGNKDAARVLDLRKNSNAVLATVIWGNVGTNVFLTLLSGSVLAGFGAFFFSTVMITLFGEIAPQAYFSRNALRMAARFLPFLIFWRTALFFVVRPTAALLNLWLGVEGIVYLHERDVRSLVARAAAGGGTLVSWKRPECRTFLTLTIWRLPKKASPWTRKALLACLSRMADASYQHSILHQTILSFSGSVPQARSGSSSPIWAVSLPSCWIPTISCVQLYSTDPIRFKACAGIGRSSCGTCRRRSAMSLGS